MTQNDAQYQLYDDPKSQIRFLELALGDQEWRARIHIPAFEEAGAQRLHSLQQALRKQGYHVQPEIDSDGHQTLLVHHLGSAPNLVKLFKEQGLVKGGGYAISNPIYSLKELLNGVGSAAKTGVTSLKDPARANGTIFLAAEGFLFAAAGGNPHGKWYTPKNLLQGVSASCFLSQSAAYMFWAKKGDERISNDLQKQLDTLEYGHFDQLPNAQKLTDRPTRHALDSVRRTLEDHPIQAGAILNNAGMLAYLGHAVLERQHRVGLLKHTPHDAQSLHYLKKGFKFDIGSTIVSMLGWSSLLLTPKEYEEKSGNPFVKLWQDYRENPQRLTALTSVASSSQRLYGSLSKGNKLQAIGESIYIPGDLLLFFVKNHEYGASRHGDYDGLVEKVSAVIQAMPGIFSPNEQQALFANTASYLAKQHAALAGPENQLTAEQTQQEEATLQQALAEANNETLTQRFEQTLQLAHNVVERFPPSQQAQAAKQMIETLPNLTGLHVQANELSKQFDEQYEASKTSAYKAPNMHDLAPAIGKLVFSIPGEHAANNALQLQAALSSHMQNHPQDGQTLRNSMLAEAKQQVQQAQRSSASAALAIATSSSEKPNWQSKLYHNSTPQAEATAAAR